MSSLQLTYDDIFDSFLGSVTDYKLATLEKSSAYELMSSWLQKGVHKSYVKRLFKTSSLDNVTQIFIFELKIKSSDMEEFMGYLYNVIDNIPLWGNKGWTNREILLRKNSI